ncbi:hypothetical protein [Amycolatopsis albispora]|uniref:Uncharacterized protein n=1 Tax=Amycolatopsis albispora TaxID=1804986 RepID=A0A344L9Q6_9PSEU|nr:hypothetical protein [Amycolatopsis albispora]AXB44780.1 hypothetical protein A4R43_21640 [Amycolatopsis albispora]
MNDDTDPHGRMAEPGEIEPDDVGQEEAVNAVLADGPLTMAGLYRLASAADRAQLDNALDELLHTLDRMPSGAAEQWLTDERYNAEDNQRAFREIRRAEEERERERESNQPPPEEDWSEGDWTWLSSTDS